VVLEAEHHGGFGGHTSTVFLSFWFLRLSGHHSSCQTYPWPLVAAERKLLSPKDVAMSQLAPGVIFFLAPFLPLVPRRIRSLVFLVFPLLAFGLVVQLVEGSSSTLGF
jgi:hypothetical protein